MNPVTNFKESWHRAKTVSKQVMHVNKWAYILYWAYSILGLLLSCGGILIYYFCSALPEYKMVSFGFMALGMIQISWAYFVQLDVYERWIYKRIKEQKQ